MGDLELQLNPLTKLHIFQEARKLLFWEMDSHRVTPERCDEILDYVEKEVVKVETPAQAEAFYHQLANKFQELSGLEKEFSFEYEQKLDLVIKDLVQNIMEKGDLELAAKILDEVKELEEKNKNPEKIAEEYPEDFGNSLQKIKNNS